MNFNLVLVAVDPDLENKFNIFLEHVEDSDNISVHLGKFQELTIDAIVSPANSYGVMDGGIDAHINNYLNEDKTYKEFIKMIQLQLSKKVNSLQQPGSAILLESNCSKCPYIIHSPTMQVPSIINNKEIIYWCIFNILSLVQLHNEQNVNKINTVCMPGMGTGCGNLPYEDFVKLLGLAYKHFKQNLTKTEIDWEFGVEQHNELKFVLNSLKK